MSMWLLLRRWVLTQFGQLSGRNLLLSSVMYAAISWFLLSLAGEHALTHSLTDFIYYLFVTASTAGLMFEKILWVRRMVERKWSNTSYQGYLPPLISFGCIHRFQQQNKHHLWMSICD